MRVLTLACGLLLIGGVSPVSAHTNPLPKLETKAAVTAAEMAAPVLTPINSQVTYDDGVVTAIFTISVRTFVLPAQFKNCGITVIDPTSNVQSLETPSCSLMVPLNFKHLKGIIPAEHHVPVAILFRYRTSNHKNWTYELRSVSFLVDGRMVTVVPLGGPIVAK